MEDRAVEQKIVMMNLAQCWQCKQYLPPGAEIRSRQMMTSVLAGRRDHLKQYELVSLCTACDDAVAEKQKQEEDRTGQNMVWVGRIVGMLAVNRIFYHIGWPLPIAIIVTVGLLWYGILGRSMLGLWIAENTLETSLEHTTATGEPTLLAIVIILAMLVTKYGWNEPQQENLPAEGGSR